MEDTILTLHPEGKQGVRILKRRYDTVKDAILSVLEREGEIAYKDLNAAVVEILKPGFDGSIPWYVITVKLDLEARGMVTRIEGSGPQRVRLGGALAKSVVPEESRREPADTMQMLEKLGTLQNRNMLAKHGTKQPMFGVSVAQLRQAAKQIGKSRELAALLWDTGNFDAMALATLIDDPEAVTTQELDRRVKNVNCYHLADFYSAFVAKTRFAVSKMQRWTASPEEFVRRCGYTLVITLARNAALTDDSSLEGYISEIESEIHSSPPRAREMMNKALIEIGSRPGLHRQALDAALRIGPVPAGPGETGGQTPDAYTELKARS